MNKTILVLAIVLLMINSYFIFISPDNDLGDIIGGTDDDDDQDLFKDLNVSVPAVYHGDIANYNNEVFGEMYFINHTSGNWTKITISMIGSMINSVLNVGSHEDGFGVVHQAVPYSEFIDAKVTIKYTEGNEYDPEADGEDITINGDAQISRKDYKDLLNEVTIKSITDGKVEIDQTLQMLIPLSYKGKLRSYPDPNNPTEETLDEIIFGDGKSIKLNDTGKIDKSAGADGEDGSFYSTVYEWTADQTEEIAGYKTMRINIDASFGESEFRLPFLRQVWIANDISHPVKIFTRTNQSFADEEGEFYFILQNTRTMRGFTRGDISISWGQCTATSHYPDRHPLGGYSDWDYFPGTGPNFDQSSFDFDPNEALSIAMSESQGLNDFIDDYDGDVICYTAQYNSTSDPLIVTQEASHRWWFLFGSKITQDEWEDYRDNDEMPKARYSIQVAFNETKLGLSDTKEVEVDNGPMNWSASLSKDDLDNELLTLTTAELILKSDPEVKEKIYNNPLDDDKIYWDDPLGETSFYLGEGVTQEDTPSIGLIETLTGFTIPQSKLSWMIQKGRLYSSGADSGTSSTFAATVNVETGQIQYVLEVEGTSLFSLFG